MGVGFLLAAGTTSFINVRTPTFILYFIVLGLLLASMVIDFMVLRIRIILIQHHVDTLFERYTEMSYEEVLKRFTGIAQLMVHDYEETGNQKSHLLIVAWYFLIIGLIAVLMFVVTSVILYQDNEITI
jgi:hypothetical protein